MDRNWPIITLTTDFGWRDYHLGLLKGSILSTHRRVQIVDISHDIPNYDIVQAAYLFQNAYPAFPEQTIHVVSVHDYYQARSRFLAIYREKQFFIGPDNGLFSLLFPQTPEETYTIDFTPKGAFPLAEIYCHAISHIIREQPFYEIGRPVPKFTERLRLQPVIGPDYIRSSVIYIDTYGNVTLNIGRGLLEQVGKKRPFRLSFKRHESVHQLQQRFHDVAEGELLCRINSADYLEIGINMGRASSLLGLELEDTVQLDFQESTPS